MRAVITDAEFESLDLERTILEEAGFDVVTHQCRTPEEVIEAASGATALLVQYAPITAEVLKALEALRVVARYGVGVDNVDLEAAADHGVWVANVTDYGAEEVGMHAVSMLLAVLRHLPFHDRTVRAGTWSYQATGPIRRISDLTLGIVGLGRIAQVVATTMGPLFARVVAYDPFLPRDAWPEGIEQSDLDGVFAISQAISLHAPLTDETRNLVDRRLLTRLPEEGGYLVNTARGGLVDPEAVLWALDAGHLQAAALDVMPAEPPDMEHPLLHHPRTLVSPHVAWYSEESELDLRKKAAGNIAAWARNGRPNDTVVEGATDR